MRTAGDWPAHAASQGSTLRGGNAVASSPPPHLIRNTLSFSCSKLHTLDRSGFLTFVVTIQRQSILESEGFNLCPHSFPPNYHDKKGGRVGGGGRGVWGCVREGKGGGWWEWATTAEKGTDSYWERAPSEQESPSTAIMLQARSQSPPNILLLQTLSGFSGLRATDLDASSLLAGIPPRQADGRSGQLPAPAARCLAERERLRFPPHQPHYRQPGSQPRKYPPSLFANFLSLPATSPHPVSHRCRACKRVRLCSVRNGQSGGGESVASQLGRNHFWRAAYHMNESCGFHGGGEEVQDGRTRYGKPPHICAELWAL